MTLRLLPLFFTGRRLPASHAIGNLAGVTLPVYSGAVNTGSPASQARVVRCPRKAANRLVKDHTKKEM
ncbi:MAG: hypothetical protein V4454_18700 [Pseudomonadota bacterium]